MKSSNLAVFSLFLLMGFFNLYVFIQTQSNSVPELKVQNEKLRWQLKNQELKTMLAYFELEDYRQNLALLLPSEIKDNPRANYQLRNLASVVKQPLANSLEIERASSLLVKAKKSFGEKEYFESNKLLQNLIDDYPNSMHSVEAYFLALTNNEEARSISKLFASGCFTTLARFLS